MELELTNTLFEWLLAEWAGYGNNPAELFSSLRGVNRDHLADEFVTALRNAGATDELVNKFRRKTEPPSTRVLA